MPINSQTWNEAREAGVDLLGQLDGAFNYSAKVLVLSERVNINTADTSYYIRVALARKPTKKEAALLPREFNRVRVEYDIRPKGRKNRAAEL